MPLSGIVFVPTLESALGMGIGLSLYNIKWILQQNDKNITVSTCP
jgi:hypothetical protein